MLTLHFRKNPQVVRNVRYSKASKIRWGRCENEQGRRFALMRVQGAMIERCITDENSQNNGRRRVNDLNAGITKIALDPRHCLALAIVSRSSLDPTRYSTMKIKCAKGSAVAFIKDQFSARPIGTLSALGWSASWYSRTVTVRASAIVCSATGLALL